MSTPSRIQFLQNNPYMCVCSHHKWNRNFNEIAKRNQSTCHCSVAWHRYPPEKVFTSPAFRMRDLFNMKMKYVNSFEWEVVFCFLIYDFMYISHTHITHVDFEMQWRFLVNKCYRFMVIDKYYYGCDACYGWKTLFHLIRFRGRKSQVSFFD